MLAGSRLTYRLMRSRWRTCPHRVTRYCVVEVPPLSLLVMISSAHPSHALVCLSIYYPLSQPEEVRHYFHNGADIRSPYDPPTHRGEIRGRVFGFASDVDQPVASWRVRFDRVVRCVSLIQHLRAAGTHHVIDLVGVEQHGTEIDREFDRRAGNLPCATHQAESSNHQKCNPYCGQAA